MREGEGEEEDGVEGVKGLEGNAAEDMGVAGGAARGTEGGIGFSVC